jgi:Zn-finger in ubiquitin-hydrolases and other protein
VAARASKMRRMTQAFDATVPPSGPGCASCVATGGWWFHLRRCAACGLVGCCDSSPSQHASRHAVEAGHAIAQTFEPGEDWYWDYERAQYGEGPELAPPHHHPLDQPVPGPAGRVPEDWREQLH